MKRDNAMVIRITAIILILFGVVFGSSWGKMKNCFGDYIFSLVGIPAWSNGSIGTHYPGLIGLILIVIGIGVLNSTLTKKVCFRIWSIIILIFIFKKIIFSFL